MPYDLSSAPDDLLYPPRHRPFRCSDGFCGGSDCAHCYPTSYDGHPDLYDSDPPEELDEETRQSFDDDDQFDLAQQTCQ